MLRVATAIAYALNVLALACQISSAFDDALAGRKSAILLHAFVAAFNGFAIWSLWYGDRLAKRMRALREENEKRLAYLLTFHRQN